MDYPDWNWDSLKADRWGMFKSDAWTRLLPLPNGFWLGMRESRTMNICRKIGPDRYMAYFYFVAPLTSLKKFNILLDSLLDLDPAEFEALDLVDATKFHV